MPYVTRDPDNPCKTCATLPDKPLGCAPCDWQPCQWTCDGCDGGPEMIHDPGIKVVDKHNHRLYTGFQYNRRLLQ